MTPPEPKRTEFSRVRQGPNNENLLLRNHTREECVTVAPNVRHEHRELYVNGNENRRTEPPPLVFKMTYMPHIKTKDIKSAMTRHWHFSNGHPELSKLFPQAPILAYERALNLKDLLVK